MTTAPEIRCAHTRVIPTAEAMALADHCVVMNNGRIDDEGPPERIYARPATIFSASFMGESTLLGPGYLFKIAGLPGALRSYTLAVRPENLRLAPETGDVVLGEQCGLAAKQPVRAGARRGRLFRRRRIAPSPVP